MEVLVNGQLTHRAEINIRQDNSVQIRLIGDKFGGAYLNYVYDKYGNNEIDIVIIDNIDGLSCVHRAKAVISSIHLDIDNYNRIMDCECTPRYNEFNNIIGVNYSVEWMEE